MRNGKDTAWHDVLASLSAWAKDLKRERVKMVRCIIAANIPGEIHLGGVMISWPNVTKMQEAERAQLDPEDLEGFRKVGGSLEISWPKRYIAAPTGIAEYDSARITGSLKPLTLVDIAALDAASDRLCAVDFNRAAWHVYQEKSPPELVAPTHREWAKLATV